MLRRITDPWRKRCNWAICAISALVLLWEHLGPQAEFGCGQDCGLRWEHSKCSCQEVCQGGVIAHLYTGSCGRGSSP